MRSAIRHLGTLVALLAANATLPAAAGAQQPAPAPRDQATAQARALQPNSSVRDWIDAGDALVSAAQLRPSGDVRAVDDLVGAAGAYRVAGRVAAARRTVLQAARQALRLHDPDRAAHAYLAAGSLSFELRDEENAQEYLGRAARLAANPRLSAEQKRTIVAILRETRSEHGKD